MASWYDLPTEVLCMIATHFLNLEVSELPLRGLGYPRPAQTDLSFAQIDRRARNAYIQALGIRQAMMEVRFHKSPSELQLNLKEFGRELIQFLPTSKYQTLCHRDTFSILTIGIGSVLPDDDTRCCYKAILPLTEENIMLLSMFVFNNTHQIQAVSLRPEPIMDTHKLIMVEVINKMSTLFRNIREATVVNSVGPSSLFAHSEVTKLRNTFWQTTKSLDHTDKLCEFYQPHLDILESLLTHHKRPLKSLTLITTHLLSSWVQNTQIPEFDMDQLDNRVMSGFKIFSNMASITMRSLAEFLLSQPNTKRDSHHHIFHVDNPNPGPPPNIHFDNLIKCMLFASREYLILSNLLTNIPNTQLPVNMSSEQLTSRLAIIQDSAILELALSRYKTLPGIMRRFLGTNCRCRESRQPPCSGIHQSPWCHWKRAQERADLIRRYFYVLKKERTKGDWIEKWLDAFESVEARLLKSLTGWRCIDDEQIVEKPVRDFESVEFVFQYAPTLR